MFYMSIPRNLAVAQIPKAGLQTISEWLGREFPVVPNEEALKVSRRVAFIRHPIERLASCYSFFYWLTDYGRPSKEVGPVTQWEPFVDLVLSRDNEHWRPQVEHVGDVPNVYRRFENLAECYEEFRPGLLPHNNRASRLPTNDYRKDDLLALYADDLTLWGNC